MRKKRKKSPKKEQWPTRRQAIKTGLGLATLGATAFLEKRFRILGIFGDEKAPKKTPTRTPSLSKKGPTPLSNEEKKRRAKINAAEYKIEGMRLTLGVFQFEFESSFSPEEIKKIAEIFSKGYPIILQHIPEPENGPFAINVTKIKKGVSTANFQERTLRIKMASSDGLQIHEFIHLLHGENDTHNNFVEEGIAVAVSEIVTNETGMESWGKLEEVIYGDTLKNGKLGIQPFVPYSYYRPLNHYRYREAGNFWLEIEKEHPGFIREFHLRYYDKLRKGESKKTVFSENFDDGINGEFFRKMQKASIGKIARSNETTDNTYSLYYREENGKKALHIFTVSRDKNGGERPISNAPVNVSVTNHTSGLQWNYQGLTGDDGSLRIYLNDLSKRIGLSSKYTATIEANDFSETIEIPDVL